MKDYDVFVDASVESNLRGACAGAVLVDRSTNEILNIEFAYQPNGTNNSGEACAILIGVNLLSKLRDFLGNDKGEYRLNLFSDSMISLFGVRQWIFKWLPCDASMVLHKNDGEEVKNQNYFKLIYNKIMLSNLPVNLYHQRGHCVHDPEKIKDDFHKMNRCNCFDINVTPEYLGHWNDYIDRATRDILYNGGKTRDGVPVMEDHLYELEPGAIYMPEDLVTPGSVIRYKDLINHVL